MIRSAPVSLRGFNMWQYPFHLTHTDEGSDIIRFRDIPEAITEVWSEAEIRPISYDAFITSLDFYVEDKKEIPLPSKPRKGDLLLDVSFTVTAKILLLNAMARHRVRPVDLANLMKVKPQEVTRLLNLRCGTKIDTIDSAVRAVGEKLVLSLA